MTDFMTNDIVPRTIRTIFATLDSVFFFLLKGVYQVFFNVSTAEILSNELIRDFYYRCQLVIGVFMLFKLAVTILEGIMDPARVTDKKAGAGKVISRIITSLVILALITPINIPNPQNKWEKQVNNNGLLFGALYSLQERILSNNTIGKLVLGTADGIDDADEQGQTLAEDADEFAVNILRGFLRINVKKDSQTETGKDPEVDRDNWMCTDIPDEQIKTIQTGPTEAMLKLVNENCSKEFYFAYLPLIGGIVALVISVVLILYTVDVAIRALKLAILRLMAPIPIISHMSISAKEGKGEDAFNSWVRSLTSTYLELFIRLAIMYFVIYLIHDMIENGIVINTGTGIVGILSFIFIVIGIFIFARQAPKFIEHSLGMKGSAGAIGATIAAAGIGSLRGGGDRNAVLDSMREASRTIQNGGKDPGPGLLRTYRDNQVKKILDKANQNMQNEFYKRGLDIDDQDEGIIRDANGKITNAKALKRPDHWWQGKKHSILGFETGADVAKAQKISRGLENNQNRYSANWTTHERATGRGTTVRGGSEFHTRTDAYPESTPAGQHGTPPSGSPVDETAYNTAFSRMHDQSLSENDRINARNAAMQASNGLGMDNFGGTGYSAGQAGQSNTDTSIPSPDVAPDRPYDMGPPPGGFGGPGGPGGPPPGP